MSLSSPELSSSVAPAAKPKSKLPDPVALVFWTGLSGLSILGGFCYAFTAARKMDTQMFDKGIRGSKNLHIAGSTLAFKALGWGSLYAISGVSLFCLIIWKLSGAKDMGNFQEKIKTLIPQIPQKVNKKGRTEFENLHDLLHYVINVDENEKSRKSAGE